MNKYNNACVYKIYNKLNPEEFYIGSTTQSLTARFQHHKRLDSSKKSRTFLYDCMLEKGFDNFDIELVCCYETCENQKQLKMLEQEVMDELKPTINKYRAHCNKEQTKERLKNYRQLPEVKKRNKEREKLRDRTQYYIDNKEKHNEYSKQRYIDNKEKIQLRQKTKITCICGKEITKSCKSRHEKSNFHKDFINNQ